MIISEVVKMLINQIAKKCNITKKAVQYYVETGLLNPKILENGYKDFSEEDVNLLKKVVLYRKLGLGVVDIKIVIKNPEELSRVLYQKTLELEREKAKYELLKRIETGEKVEKLETEISNISSNKIIIDRLLELFPGYYGKFISLNFSKYLIGEIETEEQRKAFHEIIEFFDNAADLDLPKDLQAYLDECSSVYASQDGTEIINNIIEKKNTAIKDVDEFINNNKELIIEYNKLRQTDEFKNSPAFRLMEYMKSFCANSGYNDIFIPAMRKLSLLYNEYYERLIEANNKFVELYAEFTE